MKLRNLAICMGLASLSSIATAEDHWYQIGVSLCPGGCVQTFTGTTSYSLQELQAKSREPGFIKISNLVYFDNQQKPKPWTEWNDKLKPEIHVVSGSIATIQELVGDPIKR